MELRHPSFQRITINPEVCFGKPCIRGLRFPVATLLAYLANGVPIDTLTEDFPFLEKEDVFEALAFAASAMEDHFLPLKEHRA